MIEGTLESVSPDGLLTGWLRDSEDPLPASLKIFHRGDLVAEAVALTFRPDLLISGHGHGHYGFVARLLQALPPGPADFDVFLTRRAQSIRVRLPVPALRPPAAATVEALLADHATWTVGDLCRAPGCMNLAAARRAMGTARFVDLSFRFVLGRWPGKEEASVYVRALEKEGTQEEAFLLELLTSAERYDLPPALPSPWDPLFPFTIQEPARA